MSIGSGETSAFYKFLPTHVMDNYFLELHCREEEEMTAEDREVAEIMRYDPEDVGVFGISSETGKYNLTEGLALENKVDRITGAENYVKRDVCDSSRGAWLSNQTGDSFAYTGGMSAYFRPISPEIITFKTGSSTCDTDYQVMSNTVAANHYNISSIHASDRFNRITDAKPQICIESLRQIVLKDSGSNKRASDIDKSQEEKFAELLEDFLAENEDLPSELKDQVLDMLINVRATVDVDRAQQMTVSENSLDSNDDELIGGFERPADTDLFLDEARTPYNSKY